MVEVHPADNGKTEALARLVGADKPVRAMVMSQSGREIGWVVYAIERDTMDLIALYSEEESLEELLVRASLNDAVGALATDAVCHNPAHFALLARLGFTAADQAYTIFIPAFFMRPCNGCHDA